MAKPLSDDLRVRVLEAVAEGLSYRAAAARFRVSVNSIVAWRKLERENGTPEHRPMGGDTRSRIIEAERAAILALLEENPALTIGELCRTLEAQGLSFSRSAVRNFLKRRGIRLQKREKRGRPRHSKPAGLQDRAARADSLQP